MRTPVARLENAMTHLSEKTLKELWQLFSIFLIEHQQAEQRNLRLLVPME
jgi:hypothetical protein